MLCADVKRLIFRNLGNLFAEFKGFFDIFKALVSFARSEKRRSAYEMRAVIFLFPRRRNLAVIAEALKQLYNVLMPRHGSVRLCDIPLVAFKIMHHYTKVVHVAERS